MEFMDSWVAFWSQFCRKNAEYQLKILSKIRQQIRRAKICDGREKGCQNGARTVSTFLLFQRSSLAANNDSRWTVCKKTEFALAKRDPKTMKMHTESMLEDVMQKTLNNLRNGHEKGAKMHAISVKSMG
jgi:hypothetical protein